MRFPSASSILRLLWRHPRYFFHLVRSKYHFRTRYRWVDANRGNDGTVPMPLVYRMNLTWRCNLRCKMCMVWGEKGWRTGAAAEAEGGAELDWQIIEKVFSYRHAVVPSYIFNGGEPFLYTRFRELLAACKADKRFVTICTNGTLLDQFEDMLVDNPYVALLVSLDGLEETNDGLRGAGVYRKVLANIEHLKKHGKPPHIGIQFTTQPRNVGSMDAFAQEMARREVDWLLFNFQWFVSDEERELYAATMKSEFGVRVSSVDGYASALALDEKTFIEQYNRIDASTWPMQISCFLPTAADIVPFLRSRRITVGEGFCYKEWLRMDILPDGTVTPCMGYPDLRVGDLHDDGIEQVWNSPVYRCFRKRLAKELLPVCRKCGSTHLYNAHRRYL
jgi:radical SAM protein with 4Fe4S-binding SPASM domain